MKKTSLVLAFVLVLVTLTAPAASVKTTVTHTVANCTTSSTTVLAASGTRNFVIIQNDSDTVMYFKFGAAAVANEGIRVNATGGTVLLDYKFTQQALTCIHGGSGNKVILLTSGT